MSLNVPLRDAPLLSTKVLLVLILEALHFSAHYTRIRDNGIEISDDTNPFGDYIKQLNTLEQNKLFESIKKYREERYKEARTFKSHGDGWLNRLQKLTFVE
jgi:hypothetical protein